MKTSSLTKTEMATAYFPNITIEAARHKLMSMINADSQLLTQLLDTGYLPLSRSFTPRQVSIITDRLGEP